MAKYNFRDNEVLKIFKRNPKQGTVAPITSAKFITILLKYVDIGLDEKTLSKFPVNQQNMIILDRVLSKVSKRYRKEMKQYNKEVSDIAEGLAISGVPNYSSMAKSLVMEEVK